jgi:predicted alpha/beta-fold hydrolase
LELAGRMGFARRAGQVIDADCVVVLPGFFGVNNTLRTRDLASALLEHGVHVLALEPRGHGRTEERFPDVPYSYGVDDAADLLVVAAWLEAHPRIRRTGLVGFSLSANQCAVVAWLDGDRRDVAPLPTRLAQRLHRSMADGPRFAAGILAFSGIPDLEALLAELDQPKSLWSAPMLAKLQEVVEQRMVRRSYAPVDGSVRRLIEFEAAASAGWYPELVADGLSLLRRANRELAVVRVPLLRVHAANDPLANAQEFADTLSGCANPNVAALLLPGGGHVGFAAYARSYYFSLVLNYFGPDRGPASELGGRH